MIAEKDRKIISELKDRIVQTTGASLKKIIVFGSRVRGDASEDSDLDVIILVTQKTTEIEKKLEDMVYQLMWDYDFKPIISLKIFAESQFSQAVRKGFSFYRHVMKEGVVL